MCLLFTSILLLVLIRSVTVEPRISTNETKQFFLLLRHFTSIASTVFNRKLLYVTAFPEFVSPTATNSPVPPDIVISVRLPPHLCWSSVALRSSSSYFSSKTMSAGNLR